MIFYGILARSSDVEYVGKKRIQTCLSYVSVSLQRKFGGKTANGLEIY